MLHTPTSQHHINTTDKGGKRKHSDYRLYMIITSVLVVLQPRLQTCVCSIAEDYSVAILSTSERKCLLVAAVHSAPVRDVAWRLKEDFLLVSCTDGKLYVWQIETGKIHMYIHVYSRTSLIRTLLGQIKCPEK